MSDFNPDGPGEWRAKMNGCMCRKGQQPYEDCRLHGIIADGFGSSAEVCGHPKCDLHVNRPGDIRCSCSEGELPGTNYLPISEYGDEEKDQPQPEGAE